MVLGTVWFSLAMKMLGKEIRTLPSGVSKVTPCKTPVWLIFCTVNISPGTTRFAVNSAPAVSNCQFVIEAEIFRKLGY